MTLAEIQAAFQAGVIAGGTAPGAVILDSVENSSRADRKALFGVYVDAYRLRLAEFVANDFPMLRRHVGDEAFASLVDVYIASAPSRQRNARWYASRLPEFMPTKLPWRDDRAACDLARFERALADAFDAPDETTIAVDSLQGLSVEDHANIAFSFHPSVTILDLWAGVAQVFEALTEGTLYAGIEDRRETVLFWRREDECCYRIVGDDEQLALTETMRGKKFSDVCTLLAFQRNGEDVASRVAGFLSQWFADGLLVRLSTY